MQGLLASLRDGGRAGEIPARPFRVYTLKRGRSAPMFVPRPSVKVKVSKSEFSAEICKVVPCACAGTCPVCDSSNEPF